MNIEEIEHTADRAFRVLGRDLSDLLVNAARAMHALEDALPTGGTSSTIKDLEVEGIDPESLLVNWLNEILFLEQEQLVMCEKFQVLELNGYHLRARVEVRKCNGHQTHIKAVTFHNLKVRKTAEGLEAEVVVDMYPRSCLSRRSRRNPCLANRISHGQETVSGRSRALFAMTCVSRRVFMPMKSFWMRRNG